MPNIEKKTDSKNETVNRIWRRLWSCSNQSYIIIGSIIFGIITWFIDALIDYLTISNISFINSIAGNTPSHETYMRTFVLFCFLLFGILSARMIKKIIESKNDLQKSEEKYKSFIEGTDNLVTQVDASGRFTYVNYASRTVFGLEPEKCLGLLASDFIHPDDRQRTQTEFENLLKNKSQSMTIENRQVSRTGEVRDTIWTSNLIYDDNGNLGAIKSIVRDITDRKQMEKRIISEKDKARKYLDVAAVMIVALNANQEIMLVNKKGCQILECREEEVVTKNWFDNFLPDRIRKESKKLYNDIIADKITPIEHFESAILTSTGKELIISWRNSLLTDENNKIIGIISSGEDITERKRAEEQLTNTHADLIGEQLKLRSKNTTLKEVLRQIDDEKKLLKHQIQANTNRIIMPLLDTLKEKTDENQREYIDMLEKSLNEITSPFVNQLEAKFSNLSPRELEICNMLREGLSTKQIASKLDISFHTVLKQRQNIRKKLGIINADINLYTYLQSVSTEQVKQI